MIPQLNFPYIIEFGGEYEDDICKSINYLKMSNITFTHLLQDQKG